MTDLLTAWKLDIAGAARRISERSLSPVALTGMMLDRIATIDPKLLSYVTVLKDDALKSAAVAQNEIANGKYRSPLHGIPIAIKDIYDTAGVKTTACSKVRATYIPASDSTVVRKFREAGAVILGKVTTHEFAFGFDFAPDEERLEPGSYSVGFKRRIGCSDCGGSLFRGDGKRYGRFDSRAGGSKWRCRDKTDIRARKQGRCRRSFLVLGSCRADGTDGSRSGDPSQHHGRAGSA